MTPQEELRMFLLEEQLERAYNSIQFLHDCLTQPNFEYAYPDMTLSELDKIKDLIPNLIDRDWCVHSVIRKDCRSCIEHMARWRKKENLIRNATPTCGISDPSDGHVTSNDPNDYCEFPQGHDGPHSWAIKSTQDESSQTSSADSHSVRVPSASDS